MRLIGGVSRFRAMFRNNHVAIVPWEEHFPILASGPQVGREMRDWMNGLPTAAPQTPEVTHD
jgi:hypothetical protein